MLNERSEDLYDTNETELITEAFRLLKEKLDHNEIVAGTVELVDAHLKFDPKKPYLDFGTQKKAPRKYIEKELNWYLSKNLSIKNYMEDVEIWNKICTDEEKRVNSNYGWCVFGPKNGNGKDSQYDFALKQLKDAKDGRQSVIFYSRPSMQFEWNDNIHAKHDFTCTFTTQQLIRNNKLEYIVNMRSNDAIFGLVNDFAWHCYVYNKLMEDLSETYKDLQWGTIHWHAGSLHIYERHWELLQNIVKEYNAWANGEFIKDMDAKGIAPPF
jgi:thymidylate synthase